MRANARPIRRDWDIFEGSWMEGKKDETNMRNERAASDHFECGLLGSSERQSEQRVNDETTKRPNATNGGLDFVGPPPPQLSSDFLSVQNCSTKE
jgi:hypothetical protein